MSFVDDFKLTCVSLGSDSSLDCPLSRFYVFWLDWLRSYKLLSHQFEFGDLQGLLKPASCSTTHLLRAAVDSRLVLFLDFFGRQYNCRGIGACD